MWTINAQHHHSTYKLQLRFRYNVAIIRLFTWESQSRYKRTFYVSFCCRFSMCLFKPIIIFNPLQWRNEPGSQPDARIHLYHEMLMSKMLVTLRSTWTDLAECGTPHSHCQCTTRESVMPYLLWWLFFHQVSNGTLFILVEYSRCHQSIWIDKFIWKEDSRILCLSSDWIPNLYI